MILGGFHLHLLVFPFVTNYYAPQMSGFQMSQGPKCALAIVYLSVSSSSSFGLACLTFTVASLSVITRDSYYQHFMKGS